MIGNPSTSSILVFTFQHAHGVYSAPNARSRHDFFRQDFKFAFLQPKIVLRTNPDFSRTLKEHGAAVLNDLQSDPNFRQNFDQPIYHFLNSASFAQFGKYFSAKNSGVFNWINPHHQTKVNKIPGVALEADGFAGLPRFVQTNTQAHPVEYAKVTILIAKIMNFRYYLDSPSKVPADPLMVHQLSTSLASDTKDGSLSQICCLHFRKVNKLLHENRGAVIETIVARTLQQVESSQSLIQIIALSATLPNYADGSDLRRAKRMQGLFYFDSSLSEKLFSTSARTGFTVSSGAKPPSRLESPWLTSLKVWESRFWVPQSLLS